LNEDAVYILVRVELPDKRQYLILRRTHRQHMFFRVQAELIRSLRFGVDVDRGRRVFADQDNGKSGRHTMLGDEGLYQFRSALVDSVRDRFSIHQAHICIRYPLNRGWQRERLEVVEEEVADKALGFRFQA
jgi:hypothetical protein